MSNLKRTPELKNSDKEITMKQVLKAFSYFVADKKEKRYEGMLKYIYVDVNADLLTLYAIKGELAAEGKYTLSAWSKLKSVVINLPENPESGYIDKVGPTNYVFSPVNGGSYPKDVIDKGFYPDDYKNPEMPYIQYSFDIMSIVQKFYKALGLKTVCYTPDRWGSAISPTEKQIDPDIKIIVMPCRLEKK